MSFERASLAAAIAAHGAVTRIAIAAHDGSTPRETGAAMLVWAEGQSGTIGGGALEFDAVAKARALTAGARLLSRPLGPALGQCCGGHVTLLLERYTAANLGQVPPTAAYARPVTPGAAAAQLPLAVSRLIAAARRGEPVAPTLIEGWFVEPLSAPAIPLWLYGAGHVGRALVATLAGLPFAITWVDDAAARFPETVPPHATRLLAADPAQAVPYAPDNAHHLVLTYSHALDLALCHAVLSRPFASLGLIGSATKRARFLKRLSAMSHPPERLARLTCPIGDPALGKHPQAIAISVAHRLLLEQAARKSGANRGHVA